MLNLWAYIKKKEENLIIYDVKSWGTGGSEVVGHRRSVGGPGPIRPAHRTGYGGIEVRKNIHTRVEKERVELKKKKEKQERYKK